MYSPRGVMMLAHTVHDAQLLKRHPARQPLQRRRQRVADAGGGEGLLPAAQHRADIRYPVVGATLQRRGGTARHDAVAWGYARAADALGVDIIENCEVTGIRRGAAGASRRSRRRAASSARRRSASSRPGIPAW
jgi:sarcosine oxidase subunit beta